MDYPHTRIVEQVDDLHGTPVRDPYRWLEELDSPEVAGWVAEQNRVTGAYLSALPGRAVIARRLTEVWDHPRVSVPAREGGRLFFSRNTGLQRQSPIYATRGTGITDAELVLDPNELSPDGSVSLSLFSADPSGRYVAYGLSTGGADWVTVHVRAFEHGSDLPDRVMWLRYSGVSWTKDGNGFVYTRYPVPPASAGEALASASRDPVLCYHRLGTEQSEDLELFSYPAEPTWGVSGFVTEDGRWLFAFVSRGTDPENQLYVADLGEGSSPDLRSPLRALDTSLSASFAPIGVVGTTAYLLSNLEAPRNRVIAVDLLAPAPDAWRTIIPQGEHTMESAALIGGRIVAHRLVDVKSEVTVHDLAGALTATLPLPGVGSLAGLSGRQDSAEIFFGFSSFTVPNTVYRHDLDSGTTETFFQPDVPFDSDRYETKQVFYPSKDGTRVPMFLTHRKGMTLDASTPTMLYAYGGFNISLTPGFATSLVPWLELGGVYAVANIRGGGEYGEEWHLAGKLDRKQDVFDDFIAAAEWLVSNGYTSPAKLAIRGGSNGGLLVGAAMTQCPQLFAVALPAVGVMDMLRFHHFSAGVFWVPEYGSPDDPAHFPALHAYSPLHNLRAGTCYPATLTTTADHDDRVVPAHSFKWAAALQAAQGCDRPVLIRVETRGSHGYRPLDRQIEEQADILAFTTHNLGVSIAPSEAGG